MNMKTMKVKDLIKALSDFAPDADIFYNDNGFDKPITIYGWQVGDGGDRAMPSSQEARDREKAHEVTSISLTSVPNYER